MKEFEFSNRGALKRAWGIFTKHAIYFLGLAAVMFVLGFVSNSKDHNVLSFIATLVSVLWGYIGISSVLAAVDGKDEMLTFKALKLHMPTTRQFFQLIGVGLISGLIILGGFIMLIIPGFYFLVRLMFANFALVDRKEGVRASLRYSWHMVRKDIFWTSLLAFVVMVVTIFIGFLALIVGVLVAYPIALLYLAILYRALTKHVAQDVVVQPAEIASVTA